MLRPFEIFFRELFVHKKVRWNLFWFSGYQEHKNIIRRLNSFKLIQKLQ